MESRVVPLHQHPEYLMACCSLINEEWQRSETARLHSLSSSCETLPTSLILLRGETLLGHAKLSVIPSMKGEACFVESVVIDKNSRGKGLGTVLMNGCEEYCRAVLGLRCIYLSTKGQEGFYKRIGYEECPPVSIYGGLVSSVTSDLVGEVGRKSEDCRVLASPPPPLPPPPPPPKMPFVNNKATVKIFMKKELK